MSINMPESKPSLIYFQFKSRALTSHSHLKAMPRVPSTFCVCKETLPYSSSHMCIGTVEPLGQGAASRRGRVPLYPPAETKESQLPRIQASLPPKIASRLSFASNYCYEHEYKSH